MILRCDCREDRRGNASAAQFQDELYGDGRRVHNQTAGKTQPSARCTVCGTERAIKGAK